MARESIEERRARLAPGAAWLTAKRESRGLSGRELARRLGINPDRIFAYERAQDEPGKDFVALLAAEYGMSQVEVWRGLSKPLPDEFEDDDAMAEYWIKRKGPEFFRRVLGDDYPLPEDTDADGVNPGRKQRHSGPRPRKGDSDRGESQERASGA